MQRAPAFEGQLGELRPGTQLPQQLQCVCGLAVEGEPVQLLVTPGGQGAGRRAREDGETLNNQEGTRCPEGGGVLAADVGRTIPWGRTAVQLDVDTRTHGFGEGVVSVLQGVEETP